MAEREKSRLPESRSLVRQVNDTLAQAWQLAKQIEDSELLTRIDVAWSFAERRCAVEERVRRKAGLTSSAA